jgi:hypothetical protein
VSELRLANVKTLAQAQAVPTLLTRAQQKVLSKPARAHPGWRKASAQQLAQALCFKEQRTVATDNTISFRGIPKIFPPLCR